MAAGASARIVGELYGRRLDERTGEVLADIVHVTGDGLGDAPAENAFVIVERRGGQRQGRYISWINCYDLDYVIERQPASWRIVEPAQSYQESVRWRPFGWPGALRVPTVGDLADPLAAALAAPSTTDGDHHQRRPTRNDEASSWA
jgi:hypothetical protein